ncbi:cytochrome P450 [Hortaea werneckii]|nr:cytochrome P450 [Hortaea werneckii]KAI7104646.1 cytochrome P450 [Hortaea werneckii]KAI7228747.1 cytochrome P450 [Hortaea werneckii]KAI7335755.1 cytochrome P450 [Hortaea werneckii]KAI7394454.1 cytochrome P450 [Hortaea werneckii]
MAHQSVEVAHGEPFVAADTNASFAENINAATTAATGFALLQNPKVALGFCLVFVFVLERVLRGRRKLPAGVKPLPRLPGLPWAGRFWDVPDTGIESAFHFGALHKKYGPIYEWKVMGTTHAWIETDKVARDLFVRRQRNYCDRNALPAAIGVKEDMEILPLSGYSEDFKRHKNFIHTIMRHSHPKNFYGWPVAENKKTLRRLVETPDRWSEHMITHCARTIASIAWGDAEHGKKLLTIVPDLLKAVSPAGPIINKLTFLQHLPHAISPFKQAESRRKQEMTDAFYEALNDVKDRVNKGTAEECWSMLWLNQEKGIEATKCDFHEAAYAIGSSSFVAIATIGGPLHGFFLAIAHRPEWLGELQEEVDRVCGDRLPAIEDIPNLPKLRATVKEVLRWRQSTPLGVPHEALEDDVYDGYLIKKGTMLHANHFLISREENMYPKPNQFVPERWLDPSYPTYKEPLTEFPNLRGDISFGYGNRSCPGVDLTYFELCTLFGALAWSFDIKAKEGTTPPYYEVNPYVITMAKPFPVDITPRSEGKKRYILDGCEDAGYTLKDKKEDRWDLTHRADGKLWDWDGLAPAYEEPKVPKVYPAVA